MDLWNVVHVLERHAKLGPWASAIGTSAAFAIALAVFLRDRAFRRRDQARRVNAWVISRQPSADGGKDGALHVIANLRNSSEEPVYDLYMLVEGPGIDRAPADRQRKWANEIAPGHDEKTSMNAPVPKRRVSLRVLKAVPFELRIELVFRDARGYAWRRRGGRLRHASRVLMWRLRRKRDGARAL